ncbi:hypothetical protein AVEN_182903-1, partial [Araneus ventricosus]
MLRVPAPPKSPPPVIIRVWHGLVAEVPSHSKIYPVISRFGMGSLQEVPPRSVSHLDGVHKT